VIRRPLILGVDLGQQRDYTAMVGLQRGEGPSGRGAGYIPATWEAVHIERVPLGTTYHAVAAHVTEVAAMMQAHGPVIVAVDATGVGVAVVEIMRLAVPRLVAVTITGGRVVGGTTYAPSVPKPDLVACVSVALQNRTLTIPSDLSDAAVLTAELSTFRSSTSVDGATSYSAWRERDHDDLVLALAIGLWVGERAARFRGSVSTVAGLSIAPAPHQLR
jgi:hypothetical protein